MKLKNCIFEKRVDGSFDVESQITGKYIVAIKRIDGRYIISGSSETIKNAYGQDIPKTYSKFEICDLLNKR